jgi:flagellar biosynthesis/type III secretory pathway ATPase
MTGLKTDASLLQRLQNAATCVLTAEELKKQRVSFVMGSLGRHSTATRAQVEEILAKQEGREHRGKF